MIVFYVVLVSLALLVIKWYKSIEKCDLDKIPGPPGYPIIGNLLDAIVDRVELFKQVRKWGKEYGGIHKVSILHLAYSVEISNPDDAETVLSSPTHNTKSFFYKYIKAWLRDGLLLSKGAKWHERRKILTPAFHFNILRHFTTILEENSQNLVKILEAEIDKPKTNIIPLISGYTLNAICETAMGTKIDYEDTGLGIKYKDAIHDMGTYLVQRVTKVWFAFDFVFNLSSYGRSQKKTLEIVREFPSKVIHERRQYRQKHGENFYIDGTSEQNDILVKNKKRMAMLDLLLHAESENKIDQVGIQEEVDTFMFEGHDTTASALNFAFMELANNKNIQDKVVDELGEIFGDSDRHATMEDLNKMKYLECFIKETLRLYPSVHLIGRMLGEKVTLSNYVVPARTMCSIHIFDLHRRSDMFPNPLVFDPDRFLPENSEGRHPYAYIPFSAGPRNCIGQRFAMLEMKSAIAAILRRLEMRPVTKPCDIEISGDIVLRTTHPIYVSFALRN